MATECKRCGNDRDGDKILMCRNCGEIMCEVCIPPVGDECPGCDVEVAVPLLGPNSHVVIGVIGE
jgi:hypothetical protein